MRLFLFILLLTNLSFAQTAVCPIKENVRNKILTENLNKIMHQTKMPEINSLEFNACKKDLIKSNIWGLSNRPKNVIISPFNNTNGSIDFGAVFQCKISNEFKISSVIGYTSFGFGLEIKLFDFINLHGIYSTNWDSVIINN